MVRIRSRRWCRWREELVEGSFVWHARGGIRIESGLEGGVIGQRNHFRCDGSVGIAVDSRKASTILFWRHETSV